MFKSVGNSYFSDFSLKFHPPIDSTNCAVVNADVLVIIGIIKTHCHNNDIHSIIDNSIIRDVRFFKGVRSDCYKLSEIKVDIKQKTHIFHITLRQIVELVVTDGKCTVWKILNAKWLGHLLSLHIKVYQYIVYKYIIIIRYNLFIYSNGLTDLTEI